MALSAADKLVRGDDLTYIAQLFKAYFQAKESGKGLSTNDFTTELLSKLNDIDNGAEVNVIESIKVNTSALTPDANKAVDITIPTKTSDLTNDSNFLTSHQDISGKANLNSPTFTGTPQAPTASTGTNTTQIATTAFVTTAVNNAISGITGLSFNTDYSSYAALSAVTGSAGVIYLIPNTGTSPNSYDEYFWNGSGYEKFGTTDVDLSGYVQTSALEQLTSSEIETLLNL